MDRRTWRAALQPDSLMTHEELRDALPRTPAEIDAWLDRHIQPIGSVGAEPLYLWGTVLAASGKRPAAAPCAPEVAKLPTSKRGERRSRFRALEGTLTVHQDQVN